MGLKSMIRRWLDSDVPQPPEQSPSFGHGFMNMVSETQAAVVAWKIENGYIVMQRGNQYSDRAGTFRYCADTQSIADFIATVTAREAMMSGSDIKKHHAAQAYAAQKSANSSF